MKYDLKRPCAKCPFVRDTPMKLTRARIRQIEGAVCQHNGATFPCHETLDYDDGEPRETARTQHCAGALLYADRHGVSSQLTRIAHRLGMFDPDALDRDVDVWEDLDEWLAGGAS